VACGRQVTHEQHVRTEETAQNSNARDNTADLVQEHISDLGQGPMFAEGTKSNHSMAWLLQNHLAAKPLLSEAVFSQSHSPLVRARALELTRLLAVASGEDISGVLCNLLDLYLSYESYPRSVQIDTEHYEAVGASHVISIMEGDIEDFVQCLRNAALKVEKSARNYIYGDRSEESIYKYNTLTHIIYVLTESESREARKTVQDFTDGESMLLRALADHYIALIIADQDETEAERYLIKRMSGLEEVWQEVYRESIDEVSRQKSLMEELKRRGYNIQPRRRFNPEVE